MLPVHTILLVLGLTPNVSAQISPYVAVLRSSLVPISYWIDPDNDPVRLGLIATSLGRWLAESMG